MNDYASADRADVETAAQLTGAALLILSTAAVIFAIFAFLGRRWAAYALAATGVVYALVSVYNMIQSGEPTGVVSVVYVAAAIALVFATSKEWFAYKAGQSVSH